MGRRIRMIWKLVWIYEGAQCLRLLECHIIFVASANTITLQGTLSILLVISAEIIRVWEIILKCKLPNFLGDNCSFLKKKFKLDGTWKWYMNCWFCFGSQFGTNTSAGKGVTEAHFVMRLCLMSPIVTVSTSNSSMRYI